MKKILLLFTVSILSSTVSLAQTENYNLEARNLHKKVRKTIEHYYSYDKASGGFVRKSVNINRYNDDGFLIESYSLYNSKYSEGKPVKKLYNYNSDGLLVSTKDISDSRGKYSTELRLTYDNDGHLIKKESIYNDGSKIYSDYQNDRRGRVINKKDFNKENQLTADTNYEYSGSEKVEKRTSFSTKDGSIIGTYITTYKDDKRVLYNSESKYGTSKTTYEYDKNNNVLASYYTGKTSSKTTYDYEYDKKDNWVKKHYRSGKYQYFYFREIYFDNGDVTGSSEFDKRFINRLGNFANVEVVPLKKKESTTTKKNTSYTRTNSSYVRNKLWNYDYVFVSGKVKKLKGSLSLKTTDNQSLKIGSNADVKVNFSGKEFNFNLNVFDYKTLDDKYEYKFRSNNSSASGILWIYKKTKPLQDSGVTFNVNGLFTMVENSESSMSFYLK